MRRQHHRLLTALVIALAVAGCDSLQRRQDPPPRVEVIKVPVRQVVALPPELEARLGPCPIAEGPLREAPRVARLRREALEACNADKAAVREFHRKAAEEARGQ